MNPMEINPDVQLVLVCAGSTELEDQQRIVGSLDLPLSKQGEVDADRVAAELAEFKIETVYSSASQAAQQTAAAIGKKLDAKVKLESKLKNLNCGLWHGKCLDELRETHPTLFKQWKDRPESICPPGGESIEVVRSRTAAFTKKLLKKVKSGVVVFVAPEPLLGVFRSLVSQTSESDYCIRLKSGEWEIVGKVEATIDG